jgi:L-amino acid N-acyltransferase
VPTRTGSVAHVQTRLATLADADAIRTIYNHEVLTSTVTFDLVPRSEDDQREWMEARSGAHTVVVAVDDGDAVCGFASLSPYRPRPAYSTSVEDSVYVSRDHQGEGIGRLLLTELVSRAEQHGFHTIVGRIAGGHEASIALHRSVGFDHVGTEREIGRKFGKWLDVVVMQKML